MHDGQTVFTSVGIDIGSTTTHLIFSKLTLQFVAEKHKFEVVNKEITHRSKISLTPFTESYDIDMDRLSSILLSAYEDARLTPDDVETGAIIVTGEAAKKHNAERIVELFAAQMGKFVCATAGPHYEAALAAHGSGAVERSGREGKTIVNIDIGGGTSKIAVIREGEIVDTACISVGARPVVMDSFGRVVKIENTAKIIAEKTGISLTLGQILSEHDQRSLAETLANCLFEVISRGQLSDLAQGLMVTLPLSYRGKIDMMMFSGGVSEYVYSCTQEEFGDLGKILGEAIRGISGNLGIPVSEPLEKIRATVIGVSQYTLQLSGNTVFLSKASLLPLRNLPVVAPVFDSNALPQEAIEAEIRKTLEMRGVVEEEDEFALAFRRSVISNPSYSQMKTLAGAVVSVLRRRMESGATAVLVFESDIGMGMGRVIKEELEPSCNIVSIDEIKLQEFNFIDIGKQTEEGFIPVVVKSLIFPTRSAS